MPQEGFGIFMDACSLCEFFNMEYTADSSFLERGKNIIGVCFKSSVEYHVAVIFDQHYLAFLVGNST